MPDKHDSENHKKQKEQPQGINNNTESKVLSRISSVVKEILEILALPFFARYARKYPLAVNIVLLVLMFLAGANLDILVNSPDGEGDYTIKNAQDLCREYKDKLRIKSGDLVQKVNVLEEESGNLVIYNPLFQCLYKIQRSDGNVEERKLSVEIIVVDPRHSYSNSSEEEMDIKIDINTVCNERKTYSELRIDTEKNPILKIKSKLVEAEDVWSVFRWQCQYTYQVSKQGGFVESDTKSIGLDLDTYCNDKFEENSHASHKYYKDPYSLYCTKPHPKVD